MNRIFGLLSIVCCYSFLFADVNNFQANHSNGLIKIQWQSVNENNTKEYVVERSIDGTNFVKAFSESPKGSGSEYLLVDKKGSSNSLFYRVKEINHKNSTEQTTAAIRVNVANSSINTTWGSMKAMFR